MMRWIAVAVTVTLAAGAVPARGADPMPSAAPQYRGFDPFDQPTPVPQGPPPAEPHPAETLALSLRTDTPRIGFGQPIALTVEFHNAGADDIRLVTGALPTVHGYPQGPGHFEIDVTDSLGLSYLVKVPGVRTLRPLTKEDVTVLTPDQVLAFSFHLRDVRDPAYQEPVPVFDARDFFVDFSRVARPDAYRIAVRYVCDVTGDALGGPVWRGRVASEPVTVEVAPD